MKSSLEPLPGNKVKLSVNIDEDEFDRNIDQAFRKISREVRLPGFRAGKAPRKVLEARIGVGPAREQALRDSIPVYLARAVREHDVDLIAAPEVEITAGAEDGPVEFDATCDVRPDVTVPGYAGLRVELPSPDASDEEVETAARTELRRHGSLTDTDRPAAAGDYLTIDLAATRDGEPVSGLNTEDWSYELGQGWVAPDFDDTLTGASAGDTLEFTTMPSGTEEPADFVVTVTSVQELVLPTVDDDWVADNLGEFETVAAWHDDLRRRISTMKLNRARQELVGRVTEALVGLADIEPPEPMVTSDLQRRVDGTVNQLQSQGISMDQWFSATGQDPATFIEQLRGQSEQAARA
nr:trigger factor [Acidimicrobiia bacterium]